MSVFDSILAAMRSAFNDGAGPDQDKLAEIIGQPVDDEIVRIDAVNDLQSLTLSTHTQDIALLKAQITAIVNNQSVPLDPGTGTPPNIPADLPTTEPVLQAPPGPAPTNFLTADTIDIVASRVRAGKTNYVPQIIGDGYRKLVEDAVQITVGLLSGAVQPATGPGGIPLGGNANVLAVATISQLRREGYLG